MTVAYESQNPLAPNSSLGQFVDDPNEPPYGTYGDSSTRTQDFRSDDRIYARLDADGNSAMWGQFQAATGDASDVGAFRELLSGAKVELAAKGGAARLTAFAAHNPVAYVSLTLPVSGLAALAQPLHPDIVVGSDYLSLASIDRPPARSFLKRRCCATSTTRSIMRPAFCASSTCRSRSMRTSIRKPFKFNISTRARAPVRRRAARTRSSVWARAARTAAQLSERCDRQFELRAVFAGGLRTARRGRLSLFALHEQRHLTGRRRRSQSAGNARALPGSCAERPRRHERDRRAVSGYRDRFLQSIRWRSPAQDFAITASRSRIIRRRQTRSPSRRTDRVIAALEPATLNATSSCNGIKP